MSKTTNHGEEMIQIHDPTLNELNALGENNPFIITGVVNQWPGFTKWTEVYFKEKYAGLIISVRNNNHINYWEYDNPHKNSITHMTFSEYLKIVSDHSSLDENNYYMFEKNPDFFPELNRDFEVPTFLCNRYYVSGFWLSGKNAKTRLHYDLGHNFLAQVVGVKKLILYPPNLSNMYAYPRNGVSQIDLNAPNYDKFPRFKLTQPIMCELKAGEILYLPSCWWHEVRSINSLNISINFFFKPSFKYMLTNAKPLLRAKFIYYLNFLEKKLKTILAK